MTNDDTHLYHIMIFIYIYYMIINTKKLSINKSQFYSQTNTICYAFMPFCEFMIFWDFFNRSHLGYAIRCIFPGENAFCKYKVFNFSQPLFLILEACPVYIKAIYLLNIADKTAPAT
jgi:hypothetical protein